jgi:hypothetical protein
MTTVSETNSRTHSHDFRKKAENERRDRIISPAAAALVLTEVGASILVLVLVVLSVLVSLFS